MQYNRGMHLRSLTPSKYAKWKRHTKSPRQAAHGGPATLGPRAHRRNRSPEGHSPERYGKGHLGIAAYNSVPITAKCFTPPDEAQIHGSCWLGIPSSDSDFLCISHSAPPNLLAPRHDSQTTPNLPFSRMIMEDFSATAQTLALKIKLWTSLAGDLNEKKKHVHGRCHHTARWSTHASCFWATATGGQLS